jgi:hypothetical protein
MSKTRSDKSYSAGYKSGKQGGFLNNLAHSLSKGVGGKQSGIYNKGHSAGQRDRAKGR